MSAPMSAPRRINNPYSGVGTPPQPSSLGTPVTRIGGDAQNNSQYRPAEAPPQYYHHMPQHQQQPPPPRHYGAPHPHQMGGSPHHHMGGGSPHHHQQQAGSWGRGGCGGISNANNNNNNNGSRPGSGNNNNNANRPKSGGRGGRGGGGGGRGGSPHVNSNSSSAQMSAVQHEDPILIPTRPLLKALAKECKPNPPWIVGVPMCSSLAAELTQFAKFLDLCPEELVKVDRLYEGVHSIVREVWKDATLNKMGPTAAGVISPKESVLHVYLTNSEDAPPEVQTKLRELAAARDYQVEFFNDYRGVTCAMFTEARSADRVVVRYGPDATKAKISAEKLTVGIARNPSTCAVLVALEALMRQNKMLDDTGNNPLAVCGEALAVMLLSITASYEGGEVPDAGRLLMDFLVTFGFQNFFDHVKHSVSPKGMADNTDKVHKDAQLSVLDLSDPSVNLTPKVDKVPLVVAVFHYCYNAVSQFEQVDHSQRRAQSALSTIIGGETYWSRVLQLYSQKVSPYYDIVRQKAQNLAQLR